MITRKEYMDSKEDGTVKHRKYYGQFVNERIKEYILTRFSKAQLTNAYMLDEHLNNIPLQHWDELAGYTKYMTINKWNDTGGRSPLKILVDGNLLKSTKEGWSLSTATCIMKEAARQIVTAEIDNKLENI